MLWLVTIFICFKMDFICLNLHEIGVIKTVTAICFAVLWRSVHFIEAWTHYFYSTVPS